MLIHRFDAVKSQLLEWLVNKGCPIVRGYKNLAIQLSMVDNCWYLHHSHYVIQAPYPCLPVMFWCQNWQLLVHWLLPIVAIFDISFIQGNVLVETCQLWQSLTSREMYLSILANCGNLNCHLWRSLKLFHVLLRILAMLLLLSTCSLFLSWDT